MQHVKRSDLTRSQPGMLRQQVTGVVRKEKGEDTALASITLREIAIAALSGALWLLIASLGARENVLAILLSGLVIFVATGLLARGSTVAGLSVIAYLAAVQPAIRLYAPQLRFHILEFMLPVWTFFVFARTQDRLTLKPAIFFYGIYIILEIAGLLVADSLSRGRGVLVPSLALFIFLLLSTQIRLNMVALQQIFKSYLIGIVSIAVLVSRIYFTGRVTTWVAESNRLASGGMGPLHISFLIAVGVFISLWLSDMSSRKRRWFYWLLAFYLISLMLLTFSRSGLYVLTGAALLHYLVLKRPNIQSIITLILLGLFVVLSFKVAISITGGVVIERFNEVYNDNRRRLIQEGWNIFRDNPILGVGTSNYHTVVSNAEYFGRTSGAHSEWIRAAAEHGILGLVSWSLFALASLLQAAKNFKGNARALRLTLLSVALVSMSYNGLKLIIQPFLILVALSAFTDEVDSVLPLAPHRRSAKAGYYADYYREG